MTFILPEEQNNRHDGTRNHAALLTDCRLLVFTIRVTQAFNSPAIFGLFCTGRQPSISITTPSLTRRYEVGTRYLQNVESRNKPWWRVWGQSPPESWSSYVERMPNAEHRVQTVIIRLYALPICIAMDSSWHSLPPHIKLVGFARISLVTVGWSGPLDHRVQFRHLTV